MKKIGFIALLLVLSFVCIVSAVPEELPNPIFHPTNFSELPTVNASDYWITDIGALGTVAPGQFNNVDGTLYIDSDYIDANWCALTGCTMSGDIDMNGNSLLNVNNYNATGNIEIDGFIKVGNFTISTLTEGSIGAAGAVISQEGLATRSVEFGLGLNVFNSDDVATIQSVGGTANLNVTTQLFCDSINPFTDSNLRDVVTILSSTPIDVAGAQGRIDQVLNSTCVVLNFCSAGDVSIQDLGTMSYVATPSPSFFVFDQGCGGFTIGDHPDAEFEIFNPNATGVTNFFTSVIAGVKQTSSGAFRIDANGFQDVASLVSIYLTSSQTNNSFNTNLLLPNNLLNHNGGEFNIIEGVMINSGVNVTTTALRLPPTDNIMLIDRNVAPSAAWYWNGTEYIDVIEEIVTEGSIVMWEEPGTFGCLGNTINYTKAAFSFSIDGSESIEPVFTYPEGGVYTPWIPISDGTNGFSNDGAISIPVLSERSSVNYGPNGVPFPNSTNYTYLCANRTNTNTFTQLPIMDAVSIFDEQLKIFIGTDESIGENNMFIIENVDQRKPGGGLFGVDFITSDGIEESAFGLQTGLNDSAGYIRNSLCAISTRNATEEQRQNKTFLFNCENRIEQMGIEGRQDFYSVGKGASFFSEYDIGTQKLFIYNDLGNGETDLEGFFSSNLFGSDATFFNGSIHDSIPTTFTSGFEIGDERIVLNSVFLGSISPFVNLDISPEIWFTTSSALCDNNPCATADGSSGSADITMATNFSTINVNSTEVNFVYSLFNLIGADNFRVETNNFTGSGWEVQFTDSGTDSTVPIQFDLDSTYWNLSTVGIRFVCDVSQLGRSCFVDTVKVNGTQMINSSETVNGFDTELCGADGSRDINGNCNVGIRWDAETAQWIFAGTINASGTITGGISGTGTANNVAKFNGPTSLTNSLITDNGTLITLGDDVLITGETTLQGNTNLGGNWIYNVLGLNSSSGLWNITSDGFFQGDGSQLTGIISGDVFNNTDGKYNFSMDSSYDWETTGTASLGATTVLGAFTVNGVTESIININSGVGLDTDGGRATGSGSINILIPKGGSTINAAGSDRAGGGGNSINQAGDGGDLTGSSSFFRTGGTGGDNDVLAGDGGTKTQTAIDESIVGGLGGDTTLRSGNGGLAVGNANMTSASTITGGDSGHINQQAGSGANIVAAGDAHVIGGKGASLLYTSGRGGEADGSTSSNIGGASGGISFVTTPGGGATGTGTTTGGDSGNIFFGTGIAGTGATANGLNGEILFNIASVEVGKFLEDMSGFQQNDGIASIFGTANDFLIRHTGSFTELFNNNGDIVINNSLGSGETVIVGNANVTGNVTAEVVSWGGGYITSNATCNYLRYDSSHNLKESDCT